MKPFYPEYKMNLKVSNTGAVVVSKSSFSLLRDFWKGNLDIFLAFIFLSVQLDPNFLANNCLVIDVYFFQHQLKTKLLNTILWVSEKELLNLIITKNSSQSFMWAYKMLV